MEDKGLLVVLVPKLAEALEDTGDAEEVGGGAS